MAEASSLFLMCAAWNLSIISTEVRQFLAI